MTPEQAAQHLAAMTPETRANVDQLADHWGISAAAVLDRLIQQQAHDAITEVIAVGIAKGELEVVDAQTVRWVDWPGRERGT